MTSLRLYEAGAGTIGVAVASYALLRRKPKAANAVELDAEPG